MRSTRKLMDRYQLIRPLGGQTGRLWLAHDENLLRDVAVKQAATPSGVSQAELHRARRMAVREAQAAAQISHPNAIRVYDILHCDEMPWIVMEYVSCRSLEEMLQARTCFKPQFVAQVGLAVLDALTAAHRAGVLHRDVNPHTILIGDDGRIFLTDFGLAAWNPYDGRTLLAGETMAKPNYMAPEQMRYGTSIPEGDLWSLGATLYRTVEGKVPFVRGTLAETLAAQVSEPPDPPRQAGALASVLSGLLQCEPKLRMGAPEARTRLAEIVRSRDAGFVNQRDVVPRRQRLQSAQTVTLAAA